MIVWLNGTHGVGKTTTSSLVQERIPNSRILDAEKVGEVLMDVRPGLPETDNFQHWAPWRPLVVETVRRVLDVVGGTLVMPMTVLVEQYWHEIRDGHASYAIPVRHFVLHADRATLERRIAEDVWLSGEPVSRAGSPDVVLERSTPVVRLLMGGWTRSRIKQVLRRCSRCRRADGGDCEQHGAPDGHEVVVRRHRCGRRVLAGRCRATGARCCAAMSRR